jgi:hypothetical protein
MKEEEDIYRNLAPSSSNTCLTVMLQSPYSPRFSLPD